MSSSGSRSGSGSGSWAGSPAWSQASGHEGSIHLVAASDGSIEVLSADEVVTSGGEEDVLESANEADVSQGNMSLLDISTTDDDDTHKCKVHKLTRKNNTDFAAWRDKLICDGVVGIQECDKAVHDYANPGKKKPKNPDKIGPPISYMKECRVFQPLPSMTNPLGLCCFYPTDSASLSTLAPPKLPTTVDHLNNLLVLVKSWHRPYVIVVFEGGPIMPLGLLQELHLGHTLAHIPIFLPEEAKDRYKPWISWYPFCAYTIQNDPAFLNHVVNTHYQVNFTCGKCLSALKTLGQQMKRHISDCPGLPILPEKSSQDSGHGGSLPKK